MNDFQIHHRANGDFDVEHLQRQPREERPQDAEKGVSGMVGAEKAQGHSRASTESASDLPCDIEDDGFITVWPERRP